MKNQAAVDPPADRTRLRNYSLLLANNAIFWVGISLISPITILPLFVAHLTDSNLLVGAVPAIVQVSWALPQLFGPAHFERRRYNRRSVAGYNMAGRLLFTAYGAMVILLTAGNPGLILVLFFVFMLIFRGTSGFTTTGWVDILGKVIDPRARGRFLGIGQAAGGLMGAGGVWLAGRVMGENAFPQGFGASMIVAGLILAFTSFLLFFVKEPASAVRASRGKWWGIAAGLPKVFAGDRPFLIYVIGRVAIGWGMVAFSFFSVYAARELGATDRDVAGYTSVLLVAQTASSLVWGFASDRLGSRRIPLFGGVVGMGATALAVAAPGGSALYGVFALVGMSLGAFIVSDLAILLDMAPANKRPTYVAAFNLTSAPLLLVAPLVAGLVADSAGFRTMFTLALAITAVGILVVLPTSMRSRSVSP